MDVEQTSSDLCCKHKELACVFVSAEEKTTIVSEKRKHCFRRPSGSAGTSFTMVVVCPEPSCNDVRKFLLGGSGLQKP